ncbi:bifunctional helix-turn-helix transcriptional regulator/GNAT family N-acetyltransferase [Shewanella youngdeokensis]|uniref:GNAT family N-acetyltransferase n=1 Tax=Shewanella youngdeokensis TaxID=2999068 RepID=A0ABZ0JZN3_9GAMM|nr:GNAT family N-acetyltransferase [Shewanella sp. DAU334]
MPCQTSKLRRLSRQLIRQLGLLHTTNDNQLLSPVQAHTLIELGQHSYSIKQLAEMLNIDKSNASRAVSKLIEKGLAKTSANPKDNRSLMVHLTTKGRQQQRKLDERQNQQFSEIMAQLPQEQISQIESSLSHYNKAVKRAKTQTGYHIRTITAEDNAAIAQIIREVSAEYGLTADKGYGVADPTLDSLSEVYTADNACYWVVEHQGQILGGGGIAPLSNQPGVCELQKMYFLPALRGKGLARRLAIQAFNFATTQGFSACYLETTANLIEAIALYESLEFQHLAAPLGNTGHDACEICMLLKLNS